MADSQMGKLFELMAERVRDYAIFLLDPDGNIQSWNYGAAVIKQYSAQEIIGKHFSIFYTEKDISRNWPEQELRLAKIDGRFEDEGWRIKKDGSRFWANVVITALPDANGVLLGYSKITRDLTERKQGEEQLRQSEERFRLLVDGIQDYAIYMLDNRGTVTSWNSGAARIKGYEASEIIGKHFSRFYQEIDIATGKPWTALAMATDRGHFEEEGWRIRKDGSQFLARVVLTPLYDSNGEPRGFAKVTQDLTQRRHAAALVKSTQNLHDFIAVLAHELRNPLAPIRNAVQLLGKNQTPELLEMSRKIIDRQSIQLTGIVNDLLDVSRVTRGSISVDKKPINIAHVVTGAIEAAQPAIDEGRHRLEVGFLPEQLMVDGDVIRLTQALTNILNNAAKYTEPGGSIHIQVTRQVDDSMHSAACISVRDSGRGIDPNMIAPIFGMFVQAEDTLHRPAAGLGVGLALARAIVELHHGTVEAKSEGLGHGAEFLMRLPVLVTPASQINSSTAFPSYSDMMARSRILIVDDNEDAADTLALLLGEYGHEARAAHDGIEALKIYDALLPGIVLLDIAMPGMNGLELARHIRQLNRDPRPLIVAVTGWNQPADVLRSKESGFDLHLIKPVDEQDLLRIIGEFSRVQH